MWRGFYISAIRACHTISATPALPHSHSNPARSPWVLGIVPPLCRDVQCALSAACTPSVHGPPKEMEQEMGDGPHSCASASASISLYDASAAGADGDGARPGTPRVALGDWEGMGGETTYQSSRTARYSYNSSPRLGVASRDYERQCGQERSAGESRWDTEEEDWKEAFSVPSATSGAGISLGDDRHGIDIGVRMQPGIGLQDCKGVSAEGLHKIEINASNQEPSVKVKSRFVDFVGFSMMRIESCCGPGCAARSGACSSS
ncbi:hypothetical protein MVEN_01139100 [Mycena venus]|uniref:Uncharacterized protein n=1 Tax=Mycena venus TaxID=2733690 RepID=A0A8H6Y5C8_9AGAR|nr:hypothetical protein MVEN_01139100 [Mycena venus]